MKMIKMINKNGDSYMESFLIENRKKGGIWELIEDGESYFKVKSNVSTPGYWECGKYAHDYEIYVEDVILPKELFEI